MVLLFHEPRSVNRFKRNQVDIILAQRGIVREMRSLVIRSANSNTCWRCNTDGITLTANA
jgi:hypothetical protein